MIGDKEANEVHQVLEKKLQEKSRKIKDKFQLAVQVMQTLTVEDWTRFRKE